MASRIKGITVEIGGDTTGLDKALKSVNSSIKTTQSGLKDVSKLLKLDPTNTELLTQKQKLLKDAIGSTKEKLDALKLAQEQAKAQLESGDLGQDKYDALQREIIETEQELKRLQEQAIESNGALAKIEEVGDKLQTAGDKISGAGQKLLPVTAAVAGLGTAAVKTTADFDTSMSQVQATMGITKDAMSELNGESVNTVEALRDLAKQMGSETAFSASECADAMNYLALAGYDTQEIYDTLPTVLNLAAAGGIDLASASDMVTDAMSALGMETREADTMVDQMSKTASTTNTSVAQLGEAILTIGATAKTVKGGTAELNTALGILANNGIKGAEGGTHLRNVILALQSPTDKAAACMESLGVEVYDSEGNMRSLNDILGDLNTSMDGIGSLLEAAWDIITLPFQLIWENCGDTITSIWETIKTTVGSAINAVSSTLSSVMNAIQTTISTIWTAISTKISTVVNSIKTTVSTVFNAIKTTVTTIWNGIKTSISTVVDGVKTKVTTVFNSVKSTLSSVFSSIKSTATSVWNGIKSAITGPIDQAKTHISNALNSIKNFFANCKLSLPHIKMPHFSISGSFSLNPPSVPHLSVSWYKEGGIKTDPTLFGFNGSSLMAGGEAGPEAILPLKGFYTKLEAMLDSKLNMSGMEKYLAVIARNSEKGIYLDGSTLVGKLAPGMNRQLGILAAQEVYR